MIKILSFFVTILLAFANLNCHVKIPQKAINDTILPAANPVQVNVSLSTLSNYVQEFINNYANDQFEQSTKRKRKLAFQIQGNFTGSGNPEIIVFYEIDYSYYTYKIMDKVFCFVLDQNYETILSIYEINYRTSEFVGNFEGQNELNPGLGRYIIWNDVEIGCVGDFNENGIEEMYLHSMSGNGNDIYFIEFADGSFKKILNFEIWTYYTYITGIDLKNKKFTFRIENFTDETTESMIEITRSYIWDKELHYYKLLSDNTKYFQWNRTIKLYEEVLKFPESINEEYSDQKTFLIELIKKVKFPDGPDQYTITGLKKQDSFLELEKHSDELLNYALDFYQDEFFSFYEQLIIGYALQNAAFDKYKYFLRDLSLCFVEEGKINFLIAGFSFFPGNDHKVKENYHDPIIREALEIILKSERGWPNAEGKANIIRDLNKK